MTIETQLRDTFLAAAETVTPHDGSWMAIERRLADTRGRRHASWGLGLGLAGAAAALLVAMAVVSSGPAQVDTTSGSTPTGSALPVAPTFEDSDYERSTGTDELYLVGEFDIDGESVRVVIFDVGNGDPGYLVTGPVRGGGGGFLPPAEHELSTIVVDTGLGQHVVTGIAPPGSRSVTVSSFTGATTTVAAVRVPGFELPDGAPMAFFAALLPTDPLDGFVVEARAADGSSSAREARAGWVGEQLRLGPPALYPPGSITPLWSRAVYVVHDRVEGVLVLDVVDRDAPGMCPAQPATGVESGADGSTTAAFVNVCTGHTYDLAGRCIDEACTADLRRLHSTVADGIVADAPEPLS